MLGALGHTCPTMYHMVDACSSHGSKLAFLEQVSQCGPENRTPKYFTRLKKAGEGGWWKGRGLRACQSNLPADLSSWRERPTSGWSSRSGRAPPTSPSPRRRTGWGGASSWRERPASGWSSCSSRAPPTTPSPLRRTEDGCQEGTFSDPQPAVHHCLVDRVINHG